jgi:cytochrome c biogenesis protein CcdA
MSALWQAFETALAAGGSLALPLALAGGFMVGLNPCCLALYPAVAGACCASGAVERSRHALRGALAFVCGTACATTLMGILAASAGHAIVALGVWPRYALASIPLLMGTHLLGWLPLPLPSTAGSWKGSGLAAAFVAGLLLSLVIGSCGTPVLAAILAYAAYKGNLPYGAALLFLYGVGSGLPLLLAGFSAGEAARKVARSDWHGWTERAGGVLLLALGFYLILVTN